MAYGYPEFPSYNPKDSGDIRNVLDMLDKVSGEYKALLNKIDELQKAMNGYYQYANGLVDRSERRTRQEIGELREMCQQKYEQLKSEIKSLDIRTQATIDRLANTLKAGMEMGFTAIEQDFAAWKIGVDERILQINVDIGRIYGRLQELEKDRGGIIKIECPVISPFTLDTRELQEAINQIADWLSTDALSVGELIRASWVHCRDLAEWTVRELITVSRRKSNVKGYNKYMRSPFDGTWKRVKYVLNQAINRTLPESYNVSEIAALNLTCREVKERRLTAYEMLVSNKQLKEGL